MSDSRTKRVLLSRYLGIFTCSALLALLSLIFVTFRDQSKNQASSQSPKFHTKQNNPSLEHESKNILLLDAANQTTSLKGLSSLAPAAVPDPTISSEIGALLSLLRAGSASRDQIATALAHLKALVHLGEPSSTAAAIITALNSGQDAETGLDFVVGEQGTLAEAPTFRVALLDLLGQTDPFQALDYSRAVLGQPLTADEFAIALRNLAWLNPDGQFDEEIRQHFTAMLDQQDWLSNPAAGYLEAFDIALHIGGREMALQLASVLRMDLYDNSGKLLGEPETHPVNRAAFIALDRLMIREPHTIVQILRDDPSWLDWAGDHRVSLLSRLDPRDPEQRAFLQEILLKPDYFTQDELEYFANLFPNANGFSGNRLVTSAEPVSPQIEIDRAALSVVRSWQRDPRFEEIRPYLQTIETRLEKFVQP